MTLPQINQLSLCTSKVLVPTGEPDDRRPVQHRRPELPRILLHADRTSPAPARTSTATDPTCARRAAADRSCSKNSTRTLGRQPASETSVHALGRSAARHAAAAGRPAGSASRKSAATRSRCPTSTARWARSARPASKVVSGPLMAEQSQTPATTAERRSRVRHFRAWLGRQVRGHRTDTIAIFVLALVGIVMMLGIFTEQKASLPSWMPLRRRRIRTHLGRVHRPPRRSPRARARRSTSPSIQIGKVASVTLEDGHAVVGMEIEPKYMKLIHPDSQFLLRPKTGLNDMTVEVEPGSGTEPVEDGHKFGLAQTEPNINLDQFLASLDSDTRQYIQLLVAGGAQGIGGHSTAARQRPAPLRALRRVHGETEQGDRRPAHRAGQGDPRLRRTDHRTGQARLPDPHASSAPPKKRSATSPTRSRRWKKPSKNSRRRLRAAKEGLASSNEFSKVALPTLTKLIPQAQASTPAFKATEKLFSQTTAPIRDGIRPFTREIASDAEPGQQGLRTAGKDGARASATASSDSTPSSTNSPTSRRAKRRATSSTCPGRTTT